MTFDPGLIAITPVLHVGKLDEAVRFFTQVLPFTVRHMFGGYAYLDWGPVAVRLMDETIYGPPPPGDRRFKHYIDVHDVDAVFALLKDRLALLPAGDVHGPADKPYGQRELCILAPDGDLVVFGSEIAAA